MAKQFRVRALGICLSGSEPPTSPISASRPPTASYRVSTLYHTLPLCPPSFVFDGNTVPSACTWCLLLGVNNTTPTRSLRPGLPPPKKPYKHQPTYFLYDYCPKISVARQYRAGALGISLTGQKHPPLPDLCIPTTHSNQHIIPDPYTPSMTTALQSQWLGRYHVHSLVIGLADQNTCPAQSRPRHIPSPQLEDIHHPKHHCVVYHIVVHGALLKHSVGYFHVVERIAIGTYSFPDRFPSSLPFNCPRPNASETSLVGWENSTLPMTLCLPNFTLHWSYYA